MQIIRRSKSHFTLDILYLMLVAMAGYYWQERIINQDNAFLAFNITAYETFEIAHYRFTDMFTQVIPILLTKAGFSLPSILISYSLSMVIIPYLLFRYVLYNLGEKGIAWMMLLVQLLFVSEYFFDAVSETKSAFAYTLTFIAVIKNKTYFNKNIFYYSTLVLLIILSIVTHPVSVLLLGILLFWVFLNQLIPQKDFWILVLICALLVLVKAILLPTSGYENSLLADGLNPSKWKEIMAGNYVISFMKQHFSRMYLYGFIFLLIFFFRFMKFGKSTLGLAYLAINLGVMFVLCILFHKGDSTMMMEKNISVLAIAVLLPFIGTAKAKVYVLNSLRLRFILPFICLFFLHRIHKDSFYFQDRLAKLNKLVEQGYELGHKKYFVHHSYLKELPEINKWTLPEESILLSSLKGPKYSITFKNIDEVEYWRGTHNSKYVMIGPDFFMPYDTRKFKSELYDLGSTSYVLLEVNQ